MKLRILVALLGGTTLLLLASAILAQGPEPPESELHQVRPPAPERQLQEPQPETFLSAAQGSQRLAQRAVDAPTPPLLEGRQVVEPPEPRTAPSERLLDYGPSTLTPEPPRPVEPSGEELFFSEQPFLPAVAPRPVPRVGAEEMGILEASSAITAVETYDYVWGYHEDTGDTLLLRLYDGATLKGFGVARTDGMGYFYGEFFDQGSRVGIDPGDTVKVGNGVTTDTIEIVQITGAADPLNDEVTGTITGTVLSLPVNVTVSFPWAAVDQTVSSDGSGDFTADFSGTYDMHVTDPAEVAYEDAGGNWVAAQLSPVGFFYASDTYERVEGFATAGASVIITRTPQVGSPESDTTAASGADGWYSVSFSAVDPDDVIEVDDGTSVISTTVVSLTATAAPWANDVISGTALADSDVAVGVWQISPAGGGLWYKQTVTSDAYGDYAADFSGSLDVDRWASIYVIFPDANANNTLIQYAPPLAAVNETYNNVWGRATPGSVVTATLKDSGGSTKQTASATSDPASAYFEIDLVTDVETGDSVDVTGGGISATIEVTTLTALADTDADTISGVSPASADLTVHGWRGDYIAGPGFDEFVASTGAGTYEDDLSGRYDLYNYYEGQVYYSQPDEHKLFVHYHAPTIHVNQFHDGVWGYADTPDIPVTVTLRSAGNTLKGTTVVTSSDTDGYLEAWFDGSVDIVPGDKVEVETGTWTNVVTVTALSLGYDVNTDTVSGTGPANSMMKIRVWGSYGEMLVPSDANGDFTAYLGDQLDILGHEQFGLGCENEDHNENYLYSYAPYLRVNQTYNYMEGQAIPNATVNLTVTRSSTTLTGQTTADGDGWFYIEGWSNFSPQVDIQPGDIVEMTSNGIYRSLTVVAMSGTPDVDADSISGHIDTADDGDHVRVDIWRSSADSVQTTTDSSGDYVTDLGVWDLLAGHELAVWYITEDGDECGIVVAYLQVRAYLSEDWIEGQTAPEASVNITVTASGTKGTATTGSDGDGWYGCNVYTDTTTQIDVVSGDTIEVAVDGRQASLDALLTVQVDAVADTISGQAPPNTEVEMDIWWYGWYSVQSDGSGDYSFDAGAEGIDLRAGMEGRVRYWTNEGHEVNVRFGVPFLRVNQTDDYMEGIALPNATVNLTVTRDSTTFTGQTTAGSSGWFWIGGWDLSPNVDMQVGDVVEMSCNGINRSLTIMDMTGVPNIGAESISGNVSGASDSDPVRIEMWLGGADSVRTSTDGSGDYAADLDDWDPQTGDVMYVWYITDDGDECGITVACLHIQVEVNENWVGGYTAPTANVNVTLTGSGIKGTAEISSDVGGRYWAEVYTDTTLVDIVSGDTVEVTGDSIEASVDAVLTVQVDAGTNTIYGSAPPNIEVVVDLWNYGWFYVKSDEYGNYSFDGDDEGIDLGAGMQGQVRYWTDEGHEVDARFAVPYARANYTWDWVDGRVAPYATVNVTVTDSGGFKGSNSGTANSSGWFSFWAGADVVPGDTVYATSSDGLDATIEVITITGQIHVDTDTVSGTMEGGDFPATGEVEVGRPPDWDPYGWKAMDIDEYGNYEADFSGEFDIQLGDEGQVWYTQDDGHQVGIALYTIPLRRLEVHQTQDWVQVSGTPGNTVYFTVTNGLVKGTASRVIEDNGWIWTEIYSDSARVDIEVGDIVEASSEGYLRSAEVITITGLVDPAAHTICGQILGAAEYPADLHVDVWAPGVNVGKDDQTDGSGNYLIDMEPDYDVQMGDELAVWYHEPDGDRVGSLFSALSLGISSSNDDFWGLTGPPYVPLTLTLKDSGGSTKDQVLIYADKDGRFHDSFWPSDVEPGDTLLGETPFISDTLYVLPLPASVDVEADVVEGTCVPNAYINIWISRDYDQGHIYDLPTDEDGDFAADFGGIGWDVQTGDYLDIDCRIPEGHTVHRGFEVEAEYYVYVPLVMKQFTSLSSAGQPEALVESPTPTSTPVASPTATLVPTPASTPTPTIVPTSTGTATPTATPTATGTPTEILTATPRDTTVPTSTATATAPPTPTATATATPTEIAPPAPALCPTPEEG
jgi:hypothetical protein